MVAAGCTSGRYDVWVEYDREGVRVTAWDAMEDSCGVWYPRDLEGFQSDTDDYDFACFDAVQEIVVRLPDASAPSRFSANGGLGFTDWSSLDVGALVDIEVHGSFGTKAFAVQVPEGRAPLVGTVVIFPSEVTVSWSASQADLVCLHGGFAFSGRWRCGPDVGQSSLTASSFNPDLNHLGAIRLWREPSEPDVEIWERQELSLEYQ